MQVTCMRLPPCTTNRMRQHESWKQHAPEDLKPQTKGRRLCLRSWSAQCQWVIVGDWHCLRAAFSIDPDNKTRRVRDACAGGGGCKGATGGCIERTRRRDGEAGRGQGAAGDCMVRSVGGRLRHFCCVSGNPRSNVANPASKIPVSLPALTCAIDLTAAVVCAGDAPPAHQCDGCSGSGDGACGHRRRRGGAAGGGGGAAATAAGRDGGGGGCRGGGGRGGRGAATTSRGGGG